MTSAESRRRARAEHDSIRERLTRLEVLAARLEAGEANGEVREIEADLEALMREFRSHLDWEDGGASELLGRDTRGSGRATWLRSSHDELRIVLDFCRHSRPDEDHPVLLTRRVRDLTALLRRTLEEEEAAIDLDASR